MTQPIETILSPAPRDIGGFTVRRYLPSPARRAVGPFVFLDQMGPAAFPAGEGLAVRPHPHIGLATVTYLLEGEILHRDSLGTVQAIRPGEVNWMTAGRGIVHSERTAPTRRASPHRLHGLQAWVGLPRQAEEVEPAFTHHPIRSLPVVHRAGAEMRLIAGSAFGRSSPVAVRSPMFYLDARLQPGVRLPVPDACPERAVLVVAGSLTIGDAVVEAGHMAVLAPGASTELRAETGSHAFLVGGEPLDGRRHLWWNLVSSDPARIARAAADWEASAAAGFEGTPFTLPPDEHEHIPLPDVPPPAPRRPD
jgi:hypothetical protein